VTKKEKQLVAVKVKGRKVVGTEDLREKVYHTDARVTAMESQITDMNQSMGRIENLLLNRQTNPIALVGITLSALTLLAGMMFGIAQFTQLALRPIEEDVAEHRKSLDEISDFKESIQYKMGALEEWQQHIDRESQ
jgi:hypothetical protein